MITVGLVGKSGSGKTTTACLLTAELAQRGYDVFNTTFAHPLRRCLRELLGDYDKELCRPTMQSMGVVARLCDPHFFIKDLLRRLGLEPDTWATAHMNGRPPDYVIVSDVRYKNEVAFCRCHGDIIRIVGRENRLPDEQANCETETQFADSCPACDIVLANDGSLDALAERVRKLVDSEAFRSFGRRDSDGK